MAQFLYKDFLEDKRVYNLNVAYWRRYFRNLLKNRTNVVFNWMNTSFGNGQPFYDGNPMFTVLLKDEQKAVRIIQEEPEAESIEIGAWLGEIEHEGIPCKELTISLELSKETKKIAQKLINNWVGYANLSSQKMELFIDEALTNLD